MMVAITASFITNPPSCFFTRRRALSEPERNRRLQFHSLVRAILLSCAVGGLPPSEKGPKYRGKGL